MNKSVKIASSWNAQLQDEFSKPYFKELIHFIKQEKEFGKIIYPPGKEIFAAFNETSFENTKVVIIGQDPYHGEGQAHGLCFSVNKNVKTPPSLQNIYKELQTDIVGFVVPNHGDLHAWAQQGILLLNATLTVEKDKAGSHQGKGWEQFTDSVIQHLSNKKENLVFILWGKFAQSKSSLIDDKKHLLLNASHPSPFSAYNGFFGCKHFSKTNEYLTSQGLAPINWQV